MILLTVGTQIPFDRLLKAVDDWAVDCNRSDVMAQTGPSRFVPRKLKSFPFLSPSEFRDLQQSANVMIAHAGMGSILTAMEFGKPIVIMPRDHTKGEHRNAHQVATARRFQATPGVHVAMDEQQLRKILDGLDNLVAGASVDIKAPDVFTARLRAFVEDDPRGPSPRRRLWSSLGPQR